MKLNRRTTYKQRCLAIRLTRNGILAVRLEDQNRFLARLRGVRARHVTKSEK
jgi:hypothetical protein